MQQERNNLSIRQNWKKCENNNVTTPRNLKFFMIKKKKIYPAYLSKHNSNCEKKLFL